MNRPTDPRRPLQYKGGICFGGTLVRPRFTSLALIIAGMLVGAPQEAKARTAPVGAVGSVVPSRFAGPPLAVVSKDIPTLDSAARGSRDKATTSSVTTSRETPGTKATGSTTRAGGERTTGERTTKGRTEAPAVPAPTSYVIKPGETLWRVAYNHGVQLKDLAVANGISRPEQVRAGMRLVLPAGARLRTAEGSADGRTHGEAAPSSEENPGKGGGLQRQPASENQAGRKMAATGEETDNSLSRNNALVSTGTKAPTSTAASSSRSTRPDYPLAWPVDGVITSRFGTRGGRPHDGIDISAPRGTEVRAAGDGEVLYSAPYRGYGNLVVLRHATGIVTVYAHHDVNLVRKGQKVRKGQCIARVGATGHASGPHLHFEVRRSSRPDNPLRYLPP